VPFAALFLAFFLPSTATVPADADLWSGADISTFRDIQKEGLAPADEIEAYRHFIDVWPTSPLAEVALDRCLLLGVNIESVLSVLEPAERTWLVSHFKAHHEVLAANPSESVPVSDAMEADGPGPRTARTRQTRRAMRTSSR